MDDSTRGTIDTVRSFNRAVTTRLGVMSDSFLGRGRPLGEARVLWEVGPEGVEIRSLRSRLDLDSGYLSRLLRSLESAGLVIVEQSDRDHRVRQARLTRKGLQERATLDARSDAFAASLLDPLNERQRRRLTAAMADVERLLTASLVMFDVTDPRSPDATSCLDRYYAEIDERFEAGFHVEHSLVPDPGEFTPPGGLFLVARLRSDPVGCGALKLRGAGPADIKRMWVDPAVRGLGVGRRLLSELERHAAERGVTTVRLETNRALVEAIAMYRSAGYEEVDAFNDEPYGDHWFSKHLA
jgi:DNA-binding MarR family transcriptional regulator/GNAT superfamily N-acetyltransferase